MALSGVGAHRQDAQGITYLAERSASRVRGFVALTVVVGGNGEAMLSRFHELKPALARLQHPGAAKVLDAGSTPDGSVYVASEYVAGPTLSEMAARQSLERAERAEVARQMTEAVAAAHAAGVLHLDLDGSKVRVSTAGGLRAWITGFGVSVIVAGRAGSPETDLGALDTLIRPARSVAFDPTSFLSRRTCSPCATGLREFLFTLVSCSASCTGHRSRWRSLCSCGAHPARGSERPRPRRVAAAIPKRPTLKNPVAARPETLAAGKRFYTQFCANCHGPVGKGDGTTAGADPASDLTDGVWDYGGSDGEIFNVIRDGLTGKDMGGYAGRISDNDIWSVVNFIRTLSRAPGQK